MSSALQELAPERRAVRDAVTRLRLVPVMFELGARPHPARQVYRAYLAQSQVFIGMYWQSYGWVPPGGKRSGLEDEYLLSAGLPRLIYIKSPAPQREPRLAEMLTRIRDDADISYQHFAARRAPDPYTILISLYDLAASSHAQGDLGGAAAHLSEGLSLAAEAGDETSAAYYLKGLAVMGTPEDNPQRAVHLLAAAAALLEANGSGWLHAFLPRGTHGDDALAALRACLGDEAFETAWAYGRSIGDKRAVEYALNSGHTNTPGRDPSKPDSA